MTPYGVESALSADRDRRVRQRRFARGAGRRRDLAAALVPRRRARARARGADCARLACVRRRVLGRRAAGDREYERTATTVAEAYLRPGVSRYLARRGSGSSGRLSRALGDDVERRDARRLKPPRSGGGARAVGSGRRRVGRRVRGAHSRDSRMRSRSTSAARARTPGSCSRASHSPRAAATIAGVPIALPRVLVETVSAGGGSIGWVDDGGALRVGPRSAGATPGTGGVRPRRHGGYSHRCADRARRAHGARDRGGVARCRGARTRRWGVSRRRLGATRRARGARDGARPPMRRWRARCAA